MPLREKERGADRVSVVIPALNEERHLDGLLSDLALQTRRPDEVLVVDAGSSDDTVRVAKGFPFVGLLSGEPPVAEGRNLGGREATGDVLIFLDADVRLPGGFLESFLVEFERRGLAVACPFYVPYRSTRAIRRFHVAFNALIKAFEGTLPSGAGHCIAVRREIFRKSRGFDPSLKFDDAEMIRRLARTHRFGVISEKVFVSDRRYREQGVLRMFLKYSLMALFFALGRFEWANRLDYEVGEHED